MAMQELITRQDLSSSPQLYVVELVIQHHYDIHGNPLVMQDNFGFSSLTIRRLHRESGSLRLPTDHSLSLDMPQSELIPIGYDEASGTQSGSIKSQDMIFQTIPCHQQHDDLSGPFNGYVLSLT